WPPRSHLLLVTAGRLATARAVSARRSELAKLVAGLQREVEAELVRVVELPHVLAAERRHQVGLVAVVLVVDLQDDREPLEEVFADLGLGRDDRHLTQRPA